MQHFQIRERNIVDHYRVFQNCIGVSIDVVLWYLAVETIRSYACGVVVADPGLEMDGKDNIKRYGRQVQAEVKVLVKPASMVDTDDVVMEKVQNIPACAVPHYGQCDHHSEPSLPAT